MVVGIGREGRAPVVAGYGGPAVSRVRGDREGGLGGPLLVGVAGLRACRAEKDKYEDSQLLLSQGEYYYYGAVRATPTCLGCHRRSDPDLQENDLLAVIRIRVKTDPIAEGFHANRALLMSTALVTVLLTMAGSYLIVRYVIVKPVKHLKEVSDAISAGELNVRSEIQTGDEFEDLSHAFNRMLRNLVSMQDRLRKVNADLDRKVDELAQANLALYESNRLKGDFLTTMSHELRTPLNSILGFSEVLLSANALEDKQRRWYASVLLNRLMFIYFLQRKHFIDTIKLIAYRAETSMASLLRDKLSRSDDTRALLQQIYETEIDLIPDLETKTLTVRLHHLTQAAHDEAVRHLCDQLNLTETISRARN